MPSICSTNLSRQLYATANINKADRQGHVTGKLTFPGVLAVTGCGLHCRVGGIRSGIVSLFGFVRQDGAGRFEQARMVGTEQRRYRDRDPLGGQRRAQLGKSDVGGRFVQRPDARRLGLGRGRARVIALWLGRWLSLIALKGRSPHGTDCADPEPRRGRPS
jgi:hypothetical protein